MRQRSGRTGEVSKNSIFQLSRIIEIIRRNRHVVFVTPIGLAAPMYIPSLTLHRLNPGMK